MCLRGENVGVAAALSQKVLCLDFLPFKTGLSPSVALPSLPLPPPTALLSGAPSIFSRSPAIRSSLGSSPRSLKYQNILNLQG